MMRVNRCRRVTRQLHTGASHFKLRGGRDVVFLLEQPSSSKKSSSKVPRLSVMLSPEKLGLGILDPPESSLELSSPAFVIMCIIRVVIEIVQACRTDLASNERFEPSGVGTGLGTLTLKKVATPSYHVKHCLQMSVEVNGRGHGVCPLRLERNYTCLML